MRHPSNYIALSLLAAAFAGCSSTDTGSTSTSSNGRQDPLTGPLASYQANIVALANPCTWDSTTGAVTVALATKEMAVVSVRSIDKALLVNGSICDDSSTKKAGAALTTKLKSISVGPKVATGLDGAGSNETVLFDFRNGTFAGKSGTTGGISVDLGISGTADEVAILGSTLADKMGCKYDATLGDMVGVKSATSGDITFKNAVKKITVDLNDGDDAFDQGACRTAMEIYGGAGKDVITATTETSTTVAANLNADKFHGGADLDTISFANRITAVKLTLDGATASGALKTTVVGDEGDKIDGFETVTGGSGNDTIKGGADPTIALYTLNGGAGNDTLTSQKTFPVAFNGGDGIDTVDYSARSGAVTVTMGDGLANDGESGDADNISGKDVENLIGSEFADTITGNTLPNVIKPGNGNDIVLGGDGDDTMVAGMAATSTDLIDGNDIFVGGNGIDTVDYSSRITAGTSTKPVTVALDSVISADGKTVSSGTASGNVVAGVAEADKLATDVENIIGTTGADTLTGNASNNVIWGLGGADHIKGMGGNDQLDANSYKDTGSAHDCNPVTLLCLDPAVPAASCHCANAALVPLCTFATAQITCGDALLDAGDPLDIGVCTGGTSTIGTNFMDTCWKMEI